MVPFDAEWWCAQYPGSRSTSTLVQPFRANVQRWLGILASRKIGFTVTATYRPPERAWLMHWAWAICRDGVEPFEVEPHEPPIPIVWTRELAASMVARYGLVVRPALKSRHTERRAIDISVRWPEDQPIEDLYALASSCGVHHLPGDKVHYSDDGH